MSWKRVKFCILIFLIVVFCFSLFKVLEYLISTKKSFELNDEIKQIGFSSSTFDEEKLVIDFEKLKEVNEDIVGWITVPQTNIDYPIVQSSNNSFYLTHMVNKEQNSNGSIFLDFRNNCFEDDLTIIYGHNMKNDSMFANLLNYKDLEYLKSNNICYLYDSTGKKEVEIIGAKTIDAKDMLYDFDITSIKEILGSDSLEKVVVFSTCSYEYDDARFIVIGKIKEKENEKDKIN